MDTKVFQLQDSQSYPELIRLACEALKAGELIIFPTETVYGLACDASLPEAVKKIRRLKAKDSAMALQVASRDKAMALVESNQAFERLSRKFWPGPLTLVARPREGTGSIGIRIPQHAFGLGLLERYGKPLTVTSVNASGQKELWSEGEILEFARGRVRAIFLESSRTEGSSSTVCDVTRGDVKVLREGAIHYEEMLDVVRS